MKAKKCAGCMKTTCDGCILFPEGKIKTNKENEGFLPKEFTMIKESGYGIAFDVGTTTIAASLWDLQTGDRLLGKSCANPQRFCGSDVVSRITYCVREEANKKKLQQLTVEAMDNLAKKMIDIMKQSAGNDAFSLKKITKVTVVGNTAMCEIVAGVSVSGLASAPFQKEYQGCIRKRGYELGFAGLEDAQILILPAIEGYVGADALSVYTYVSEIDKRKNILAVDIGTNGEIILIGKSRVYACSAAAGPALEGAAASQGMPALPGAVSRVRIAGKFPREDIYCDVIGGCEPKGICGSALLDTLTLLCKLGVIDKSGYMRTRKEAAMAGVKERICQRIDEWKGGNRFLLTDKEYPVYITDKDIRQLQLAKGAIRAAIEILLKKAGIAGEDISCLYLAGAFGNYMQPESAVLSGLLPETERKKIISIGNGAGVGAAMALLSAEVTEKMERAAEQICHVELAGREEFQNDFLTYMDLP